MTKSSFRTLWMIAGLLFLTTVMFVLFQLQQKIPAPKTIAWELPESAETFRGVVPLQSNTGTEISLGEESAPVKAKLKWFEEEIKKQTKTLYDEELIQLQKKAEDLMATSVVQESAPFAADSENP